MISPAPDLVPAPELGPGRGGPVPGHGATVVPELGGAACLVPELVGAVACLVPGGGGPGGGACLVPGGPVLVPGGGRPVVPER